MAGNGQEGAAYAFTETGSGWTNMALPANLSEAVGAANDFFGTSVSISGNTVVVGAPDANDWQGTTYVFTGSASGWVQTAQLAAADAYPSSVFGSSVSISGDTVAVGAPGASTQQGGGGAAYVFSGSGSSWAQAAELSTYSGEDSDGFGCSVSISGNTVVVGATLGTAGGNSQQGTAYVFTEPAAGWAANMFQTANLIAPDGAQGDGFGNSVSVSGTTAVVGACLATVGGSGAQGAAYVFAGWPQPVLTVSKSHIGNFKQGDAADKYTIIVSNAGPGGTVGTVTVTDTLPAGLTATAADNGPINGWSVSTSGQMVRATRDDPLPAGSSYSATLTVSVASNAPARVTNAAAVSFWGEASPGYATASDPTTINTGAAAPTVKAIKPATGPAAGGTPVTITGETWPTPRKSCSARPRPARSSAIPTSRSSWRVPRRWRARWTSKC